ncbi:major facilitator superfamily transporter [Colletotrichum scovillei]|uniref:Major facilitator superfamily transporter n=1 Tax=Colletotrichum scovillei TaxID=1209932 RepID=A0A9P7QVS1_9PEZI|nr:major facilitator superfamily transporter [Colletotrichum scovillei]KAF4784858.1 major facilitator superfamily transporter [Colletotrichum scovillei]KAG7040248.1 major facilitator superfamily transporter [Colletotrichum scovillei]KAG7042427.1 major facilitator superfamily transporter [Colletotrichum scovillei]KAG7062459.1 major facilitator superfamily transporter [Colletotrichum scovillei]
MTNKMLDIEKAPQGSRGTDFSPSANEASQPPRPDARVDANSTIIFRYLAFDTVLPAPADIPFPVSAESPPEPAPPNLSHYTSPLQWPQPRKYLMLALSCVATFLTAYTAGSYSPPSYIMADDLGTSQLLVLTGITTFCIGFALSPMVLAPLSEIYGRYPVFVISGVVYVIFQAVCSVAPNLTAMLIARFLVGVGGSVFSSVIGGVIADLWAKEQRNTPMALFSGAVLAGTGAGPLVASLMVKRMGSPDGTLAWKWIFWHQVIVDTVLVIALAVLFKESRGSVILSRKAEALNAWYEEREKAGLYGVWLEDTTNSSDGTDTASDSGGDTQVCSCCGLEKTSATCQSSRRCSTQLKPQRLRWLVKEDEERASITTLISMSVSRPFHLLFTEPVVFFFSIWCAFAWAVLYCTFGSIPLAMSRRRNWDIEQSGYFFSAMIVGSVVATIVGVLQDRLLQLPNWRADTALDESSRFWLFMRRRFPAEAPESRLYFTCITATFLPAGLFIFGFTAKQEFHWIAPAFGIGLATWGIYSVYLATFNYFADIYHKYASSALAAQSCCRNILGGVFPLVTGALFRNLGEERAGSLLGGIATGLTLIPWALVFFGERIRAKSRFAITLEASR